jgi:hypothetical protein
LNVLAIHGKIAAERLVGLQTDDHFAVALQGETLRKLKPQVDDAAPIGRFEMRPAIRSMANRESDTCFHGRSPHLR